ncbi:MAG: hypothetical protein E6G27_06165 [Actinobacteria bacterium]|nr:MAG: hypothetical protein E6G27_06165 [Actinomycetota bacterium]
MDPVGPPHPGASRRLRARGPRHHGRPRRPLPRHAAGIIRLQHRPDHGVDDHLSRLSPAGARVRARVQRTAPARLADRQPRRSGDVRDGDHRGRPCLRRRGCQRADVLPGLPVGSPQAKSTSQLITRLRTTVIPQATQGGHLTVYVGGQTALANDFAAQLSSKLPIFVLMVVALSFLLLMVVFRSVLIPAAAAVMNLLSAAAAFGVIVAVFQWGWIGNLVGAPRSGPIQPLIPILMFAVLFGLSMDYEVFLVSRMHEEWLRRRDNSQAVNAGLAITGRTITSAALIMIVVFAAFVTTTDRNIKMIGLGMATAIALDSLIVRTMLVPAIMHTLGRANWYLPGWLEHRLPHLDLEDDAPSSAPEAELVAVGR